MCIKGALKILKLKYSTLEALELDQSQKGAGNLSTNRIAVFRCSHLVKNSEKILLNLFFDNGDRQQGLQTRSHQAAPNVLYNLTPSISD